MIHHNAAQIAALEQLRDRTKNPTARAALDTAITAIRAMGGSNSSLAATPSPAPSQNSQLDIYGQAEVSIAVGGNVSGDVQSGGARYQANNQVFFGPIKISKNDPTQRKRLEAYLKNVIWRCDQLRLAGVVNAERKQGKEPAFKLSQVYVLLASTLWIAENDSIDTREELGVLPVGTSDQVLPEYARRVVRLDTPVPHLRLERPLLLLEALCRHQRMVLLGGPGSGKSAFLRFVSIMLARMALGEGSANQPPFWNAGFLLPVYISLGGFAEWLREQNLQASRQHLWRYLCEKVDTAALSSMDKLMRNSLRDGRLLLLLDGLDEVIDPDIRVQVARAIAGLTDQYPCYAVVTCRVRSYVGAVAAPLIGWGDPVEVAPFNISQVRHFIHAWYHCAFQQGTIEVHEAQSRAELLCQRLEALPNVRELGQTPLLLTLIVILHYYGGKLPEDRADLYEDLVQLLLTRWTQQRSEAGAQPNLLELLKKDDRLVLLKEHHIRKVLEELAYRAHQGKRSADGRGLLDANIVRGAFCQLFEQFGADPGSAYAKTELVLAYLEQESGLLLNEGGNQYALPHLTYEEYLAGCYLAKQKHKPDFRLCAYQHWQSDAARWREVIFLALGRMVRGDDVEAAALWLQFMLVHSAIAETSADPTRLRAVLFAVECLQDMGGKPALFSAQTIALARLWDDMATGLVQIIASKDMSAAERVRAGAYLGSLGDPRLGVCNLNIELHEYSGGSFFIGNHWKELELLEREFAAHWLKKTSNNTNIMLPAFALARYPTTVAQFVLFVEDHGYDPDAPWWDAAGVAWLRAGDPTLRVWRDRHAGRYPNYPVVDVSWYEAVAFCRWLSQHRKYNPAGYRFVLPNEAEWEFAARGPTRRAFPWGAEPPDATRANFGGLYQGTSAVGCFAEGATPEGIYDMAGNVWEWTRSILHDYPYELNAEREYPDKPAANLFIVRGGCWTNHATDLHMSFRHPYAPDMRYSGLGFRVARHLTFS